jgi:hypothetical protein
MDPSHHIICHSNEMCKEIINDLPPSYTNHFTIHWIDTDTIPLETIPTHVHHTIIKKKETEQSQPDKKHGPTVMFYNSSTDEYVEHHGIKALQFIHNYRMSAVNNKMNGKKLISMKQSNSVQRYSKNINAILDIHHSHIPQLTAELHDQLHNINQQIKNPISDSLKNNINDITKIELQRLYSKIYKNHTPFKQ